MICVKTVEDEYFLRFLQADFFFWWMAMLCFSFFKGRSRK